MSDQFRCRPMSSSVQRLILMLLLTAIAGCQAKTSSTSTPTTKAGSAESLHEEIERGPVKVEIDISPKEPRLSDEPKLTLTVTAADNVDVRMPPFGQSMGEFVIRDFHEPNPRMADGQQVLQQVYTLEPLIAGTLFVSPLIIEFTDNRPDADGKEHSIETEPIKLEIATMIGAEAPSLTDLRPVEAPVDVPDPGFGWTPWWAGGGVFAVLLALALVWKRRRSTGPKDPEFTPQQLAWRELNDLLGSKLSETDVKEFFVQLTHVVRRYIERSTGVNAPDQTTEEFLREVNDQKLFSDEENSKLGAFLESADLVKFAGYQPDPENIKQSTHKARAFIELQAATTVSQPAELPFSDVVESSAEAAE